MPDQRAVSMASMLLVLGVLLLPGCASPELTYPTGPHVAWTSWTGPYAAMGTGYGFVAPDGDGYGPYLPVVAVDGEGRVLWVKVASELGSRNDVGKITYLNGTTAWKSILEPLLQDRFLVIGGGDQPGIRILEVRTATLSGGERSDVLAKLQHGLNAAREPQEIPGQSVQDGGSMYLRGNRKQAELTQNNQDAGWEEVQDQMLALRSWMEA